jgi:D-glycerate 3-kinase
VKLDEFIHHNQLPDAFAASAERCFLPYAERLASQLAAHDNKAFVLGINGAQGTGKSTLAHLLCDYLATEHDKIVVVLSIDDIYLTRDERAVLAQDVHPLLQTRGVPGTHDVALGISVIAQLQALQPGQSCKVPRFDKSRDDRCPPEDWSTVSGPVDLIIFEGWCIGSQAQEDVELEQAVNEFESSQDADCRWRQYVNEQLRGSYVALFQQLDSLLFLKAPSFAAVHRWRLEQEHKLRASAGADAAAVMSDEQVAEFIQHYERITTHNLALLPSAADVVIELDDAHQAVTNTYKD